jgi:CubicO group peptidase (beta-lactamase class C family)
MARISMKNIFLRNLSLAYILSLTGLFCVPSLAGAAESSVVPQSANVGSVADKDTFDIVRERLDKAIDDALEEQRIVGTVVIVAKDGKVIYRRAAGLADREHKVAAQPDTLFRLASMSKTIVSAAAMRLIQDGRLGLDDPVTKWLPEFTPKLADGTQPTITVRQLLTHTAGLNYRFSEPDGGPYHKANVSDGMDQPGLSLADELQRIASCPLLFKPGTDWHYSLSIDVLGGVIEKASGKSLADTVSEYVTGPLKMNDTAFAVVDPKRLAVPYCDGKPEPKKMGEPEEVKSKDSETIYSPARVFDKSSFQSGGAGLVGTADDYIKLLEAIRTKDPVLLKEQSIDAMTTNQVQDFKAKQTPGWGFGFGSGVMIETNKKYPYSNGTLEWGGAYGCHWFMDPARKLTVVELTNTTLEGLFGKFSKDVANAVYNEHKPL